MIHGRLHSCSGIIQPCLSAPTTPDYHDIICQPLVHPIITNGPCKTCTNVCLVAIIMAMTQPHHPLIALDGRVLNTGSPHQCSVLGRHRCTSIETILLR